MIVTEYSSWLVIPCLLLGIAYAYFLYRKDKHFNELTLWKLRLMAIFRFVVVFSLSFLLLTPLIKSVKKSIEKPIVIFAQDNSESILINKDSIFYKNEYRTHISGLIQDISSEYDVEAYSFGENMEKGLQTNFKSKSTDFSNLFKEIQNKYANRNVGALILASDGIYNQGNNPLNSSTDFNFPIYTIALGDTNPQKDYLIKEVNCNKLAFLGNKFSVRITVGASRFKNEQTVLTIFQDQEKVFSKQINVTSDEYFETIDVELEATQKGLQRYEVQIKPDAEEISSVNNKKEIIVDVIDSKQKILILANSPHPDVAALKNALKGNFNYEVEFSVIDKFTKSIQEYNLVVLHQLPSITNSATKLLSDIFNYKVPTLFVLGAQSSLTNFNTLQTGLRIQQVKLAFDETQASYNDKFVLFDVDEEVVTFLENVPPLISAFGNYKFNTASNVLFYQEIKNIPTNKPLVLFSDLGEMKVGVVSGEGIWRWRMYDYMQNSNHEIFDGLINKVAQYLALKVNKENFIVNVENTFNENEPVVFEAEVYNESFELVNEPEVSIEIYNQDDKSFPFVFGKTLNAYRLNAGVFAVGDYQYIASVKIGEQELVKKGMFSILPVNVEYENTVANHQLLYQLAENSNGYLYYPDELAVIPGQLKENKNIAPISYLEKKLEDLINLKIVFFLLLLLISTEWLLRKYYGSY